LESDLLSLPWSLKAFNELTAREFHDILRLRIDVFVVEQACAYPELDGADMLTSTLHLQMMEAQELVAYARVLDVADGENNMPVRIGRVVTRADQRGRGFGRSLMQTLLSELALKHAHRRVTLAAQVEVQGFYESLGFSVCSEPYTEDGIPHIDMELVK